MTDSSPDPARLSAELARKTFEFDVLRRVSSELNSTLELDEIYDSALRTMSELFEFHHANILLLDTGGETLTVVASRGYENQAVGGRVRVGTGVIGIVAQKRRMLHVANLGQQRAYAAAQRQQMIKAGRGAELADAAPVPGLQNAENQVAIPLMVGDRLVGVFSIETPTRRTFTEHDRALISIIADHIASAIHNAQLYDERQAAAEQLKEMNASLEARVADRTAALERELRIAEDLLQRVRERTEGPLVGDSAAVRALRDAVEEQAQRTDPLLVTGPPGSGKEATAHAVHLASGRNGAFIIVSGPELRSVHGSGGGTDAATALRAKLDLAAGGTLFLEGVHEMPDACQETLVHLAAATPAPPASAMLPPRVIASTTRDLKRDTTAMLEPFRRLLLANRIAVPPLVERREDIPVLVDYFVRKQAQQMSKVVDRVSTDSMRRLQEYRWPGNVHELRSVLERAIVLSRSSVLEIDEDLLDERFTVGSYRLVERLGSGGMGEVWRAQHRLLVRPAAVKLIRQTAPAEGTHEQLIRRFEREAQTTASLRSPHTVQLYDFGVTDTGSFFYVMELLGGLDLDRMVQRFGPQPAERVIMLVRQACRSLAEAHDYGLVHRDVKPANLFVTRLGHEYDYLKVLDFGIVKDRPRTRDSALLTAQGLFQGTPAFMAPEIIFGELPIDGRADLYSLACTAYWVLTGQLVFDAKTPADMLLHHAQTKPTPPSEISELPVPRRLEQILMRCLEKDPANRFASALDLDAALVEVPIAPWSQAKARAWWETHAPELVALSPGVSRPSE
jgi:serine/threonine protein kinase/GAF domain-containing protein